MDFFLISFLPIFLLFQHFLFFFMCLIHLPSSSSSLSFFSFIFFYITSLYLFTSFLLLLRLLLLLLLFFLFFFFQSSSSSSLSSSFSYYYLVLITVFLAGWHRPQSFVPRNICPAVSGSWPTGHTKARDGDTQLSTRPMNVLLLFCLLSLMVCLPMPTFISLLVYAYSFAFSLFSLFVFPKAML